MFCKTCGKEVLDQAVICPNCGCSLKEEAATPAPVVEAPAKKKLNVLCLVGFVLSLVCWFIDFYCLISIASVVCSIIGVIQANRNGEGLKGLGIAGICVGAAALVFNAYALIVLLALVA